MARSTFEHVTRRYSHGFETVKDMKLAIADGEFTVVVGSSGSGKSTALRMVAGLKDISGGVLKIRDEVVDDRRGFLMDEPLSNLDAKLRVQARTAISRLHARLGATTIYVTQDQVEAVTLGDRIAVMRAGRIRQVGAPSDLHHHPSNVFVADFIGTPTMNFLRGS